MNIVIGKTVWGWYICKEGKVEVYLQSDGKWHKSTGDHGAGYWPTRQDAAKFLEDHIHE